MLAKPQPPRIQLPRDWQGCVKWEALYAIALAHYSIVYARAWAAADSINARDGVYDVLVLDTSVRRIGSYDPGIVVNADTNGILASALTTHRAGDAAQVPVLLSQIDFPLASAMDDGAYDRSSVHAAVAAHGSGPPPQTLIPPRQDAQTPAANDGRMTQAIHNAAWWRRRCRGTKRSLAVLCGVALWCRRRQRLRLRARF
jgi:hypothetical protein